MHWRAGVAGFATAMAEAAACRKSLSPICCGGKFAEHSCALPARGNRREVAAIRVPVVRLGYLARLTDA